MRFRSVLTVSAMLGALAAGVLRCAVPPEPPPSQALPTRARTLNGAFLTLTGGTLDRDGLVASLQELRLSVLVIVPTATQDAAFVQDRVSLALELQAKLDAVVFIGTYEADRFKGADLETMLRSDPTFTSCYPGGRALDPNELTIDKLRLCSQDVSRALADELRRVNANDRIGCFVAHEIELVDNLTDDGKKRLASYFHDSASPCAEADRLVGASTRLSQRPVAPQAAGTLFGAAIQDSNVNVVFLQDGVGVHAPATPLRARPYYEALRLALLLRSPSPQVWANVEAFDCEQGDCDTTHPTNADRLTKQICAARNRADGIMTVEYLHHLAGKTLVTGSPGVSQIANDVDAAAGLRRDYDTWRDSGAVCTP